MRGWVLGGGRVTELGRGETADLALADNDVYNESRLRVLRANGPLAGGVVFGAETEVVERTVFTQLEWELQDEWPVLSLRRVADAAGRLATRGASPSTTRRSSPSRSRADVHLGAPRSPPFVAEPVGAARRAPWCRGSPSPTPTPRSHVGLRQLGNRLELAGHAGRSAGGRRHRRSRRRHASSRPRPRPSSSASPPSAATCSACSTSRSRPGSGAAAATRRTRPPTCWRRTTATARTRRT